VFAINTLDENVVVQHLMISFSSRLLHTESFASLSRSRKVLFSTYLQPSVMELAQRGLHVVYRHIQKIIRREFGMDKFDPSEAMEQGEVRLPGIPGRWFNRLERTSHCTHPDNEGSSPVFNAPMVVGMAATMRASNPSINDKRVSAWNPGL